MNSGKLPQGMTPLTPFLCVKDIDAALAFYENAFGFTRKMAMPGPDGKTVHGEMMHAGQTIMLGGENVECGSIAPTDAKATAFGLYLYVENVDEFFKHATTNGATVKQPLTDMFWGDRMCSLVDPFGHHWSFSTFVKEVKPEEMKTAMEDQMKQPAKA